MSGSIYLHGSEDVQNAGYNMSSAAEQMQRAAASIEESLVRHQQYLDGFMLRFEEAVGRLVAAMEPKS